jgi:alpha-N-arabinofuranosidase
LKYLEIGNENGGRAYHERYALFYDAIKAKYPQMHLVANEWNGRPSNRAVEIVDEHYYSSPEFFIANAGKYDSHDRNGCKVYVGEYAVTQGCGQGNLRAAVGEAAFMTGMERNSDIVLMASYAPLFVNVNPHGMQWDSNLIGYDAMSSYGSPSYYAQVLFSEYLGNRILDAATPAANHDLFSSVTRDSKSGSVYIKLVNSSSSPQQIAIDVKGMRVAKGELATLAAKSVWATNTIDKPSQVVPVKSAIKGVSSSFVHTMPPLSIQVIQLDGR